MAKPRKEGSGWSVRSRFQGHSLYISGCATSAAAKKKMDERVAELSSGGKAKGFGPHETMVAQAMQDYASERLMFMKGARQEADRINRFLRAAGLATLKLSECKPAALDAAVRGDSVRATDAKGRGQLFNISLQAPVAMRAIPQGLGKHRASLAETTATSDDIRARLARMTMAEVEPHHVQKLMDAYRAENREASTLALERALIRRLFNYSSNCWNWKTPVKNPGTGLTMPSVDNGRDRVMSLEEQARLDEAVQGCRNNLVGPTLTLLRETAMRSSEPLRLMRNAKAGEAEKYRATLKSLSKDVRLHLEVASRLMAGLTSRQRMNGSAVTARRREGISK